MKLFRNKLAVTIFVLSVTFLILISQGIKRDKVSFIGNGVGATFNSVQGGIYSLNSKVKDWVSFIFSFSNVKKENEALKKENSELQSKALQYDSLKNENEKLRAMLNFKNQRSEYSYIGCDIIGKSGGGLLDQFIINRGSKDGIGKNMVVITAEGLVGQITTVGSNWSILQTLANENLAVSGEVGSTSENGGIVKGYKDGNNDLLAKLYYLPLDSNIKKGDAILTSGLGGLYPKGIAIGSVTGVEEDKGKVMKNAIIKPYVDLNKLEQVLVVVPKDKINVTY
jgi:rod shape-determining protein MreC